MFSKIFFSIACMLIVSVGLGQDSTFYRQWGEISQVDLRMEQYEKDPEAEAVILYDIGESAFFWRDGTYQVRFSRRKRIKILKETALSWAEISLPYFIQNPSVKERIIEIEARTFNLVDGELVQSSLDTVNVYDDQLNEHWSVRKFAVPKVKKGSIIEYRYVLESPFKFKIPTWHFQDRIPTVFSSYSVKFIPNYSYAFISQGIEKFDYEGTSQDSEKGFVGTNSFSKHIKTYEMYEVPAFKDEAFISTVDDYLMKIDFQLASVNLARGELHHTTSSWPQMIKDLRSHDKFGKYLSKARFASKAFFKRELNIEHAGDEQAAKSIIQMAKNSYSWNGNSQKFASQTVKSFEKTRSGNAADLNLYLAGMLQAAGIKASPILLSTRDHGKIKANYPFVHFFNYVVVLVDLGYKFYLADATDRFLPYDRIPPRAINHKGLIIAKGEARWVNLEMRISAQDKKIIEFEIDPETMSVQTSLTIQSRELKAYHYRTKFENDEDKFINFFEGHGFADCDKVASINYDKVNLPYIIQVSGETELGIFDNKMVLNPFLGFPLGKNELVQEERSYPVDFIFSSKEEYSSICNIPEGYKFLSGPSNIQIEDELLSIELELILYESSLEIKGSYAFKKAIYDPKEYQQLKDHIDTIIKGFGQELVFEKS